MNINEIIDNVLSDNPNIDINAIRQAATEKDNELEQTKQVMERLDPIISKLGDNPELAELIAKADPETLKKISEVVNNKPVEKDIQTKIKTNDLKDMDENKLSELLQQAVESAFEKKAAPEIQKLREEAETKAVADSILAFINQTPDFNLYYDKIDELSKANPEIVDIKMLYLAAKGELGDLSLEEKVNQRAAELAKEIAAGSIPSGISLNGERAPVRNQELVNKFFAPPEDASLGF